MNIGFDAKRAYHNRTGLGYFSRTLIGLLSQHYPEHQYYLFNPKPSSLFHFDQANITEVRPGGFINKLFSAAWRSSWVTRDLVGHKIDLYHGLSHEIPVGITKTGIPSVVTIHDLMPERFPSHYKPIDVQIYRKKFRYACTNATHIMAISEQTKQDIIEFYKIPAEKITVSYQSCDPVFARQVPDEDRERIRKKYNLPEQFFLYVGSVIERKNLLNICKALFLLRNELDIPLVVVGSGGKYFQQVKDYVLQQGLTKKVIFLSEQLKAQGQSGFIDTADFPAVYQLSIAMIYPSFYEGFGAPVMEALWSKVPVITSNVSCLPEVGGPGAYYVDPNSADEIATGMKRIYSEPLLAAEMLRKGWDHVQGFTPEKYVQSVMDIYRKIW